MQFYDIGQETIQKNKYLHCENIVISNRYKLLLTPHRDSMYDWGKNYMEKKSRALKKVYKEY